MHAWGAVDLRIYLAKKIMVTQYQPRAMNFVLTWYNLISFILHCLLYNKDQEVIQQRSGGYKQNFLGISATIRIGR